MKWEIVLCENFRPKWIFFAKAHVLKKKDSKAEELTKKNLKAMLQGYRKSDNELIKKSASGDIGIYTSYDVSNVSDVEEIVISGSEADTSQSKSSEADSTSPSKISASNRYINNEIETKSEDTESQKSSASGKSSDEVVVRESRSNESISECDEEIQSLSDEAESVESDSSEEIPLLIKLDETTTEAVSTDSEEFDPEGILASKILEKLGKTKVESSHKGKKRKLENVPKNSKSKKNLKETTPVAEIDNVDEMKALSIVTDDDNTTSTTDSAPYVSVSVDYMPDQSFSDVMREHFKPLVDAGSRFPPTITDSDNAPVVDNDYRLFLVSDEDEKEGQQIDENADCNQEGTQEQDQDENMAVTNDPYAVERPSSKENFVSPVKVYNTQNGYVCVLRHPTSLYINGKVRVKLLTGPVEVLGHRLKEGQKLKLYAPNNSHSMCFSTFTSETSSYGLFGKLTAAGLAVSEAEDIVTSL
ncbi:uncharacterized protein LOC113507232, partial [Trichoplusia ni]|uniref:Uncharacterized protein LOC113507232 n=1 Tax=Trichoplusia ni TaxID=7111 RepID=A0A7E5X0F2_TRINI